MNKWKQSIMTQLIECKNTLQSYEKKLHIYTINDIYDDDVCRLETQIEMMEEFITILEWILEQNGETND